MGKKEGGCDLDEGQALLPKNLLCLMMANAGCHLDQVEGCLGNNKSISLHVSARVFHGTGCRRPVLEVGGTARRLGAWTG
jgi:hypothetical protein